MKYNNLEKIYLSKLQSKSLDDQYKKDDYINDLTNAIVLDYIIYRLKDIKINKEGNIPEIYHIARNLNKEECHEIQEVFYSFLVDDWHKDHEYIIYFAQKLRVKSAVPHIKFAIEAKYDYMMINPENYYSFVRKCFFALSHIDSKESIDLIKYYSNHSDKNIEILAKEQIDKKKST